MDASLPRRLVLYDGECGVCDGAVQFLLRVGGEELCFAPLQGATAERVRHRFSGVPDGLDTMVYLCDGRVFLRSRAALELASGLPWPWRGLAVLRALPPVITDLAYRVFAGLRYRLGGPLDSCRLATPDEATRFLP